MTTIGAPRSSTASRMAWREFARRQLGRVDLADRDQAGSLCRSQVAGRGPVQRLSSVLRALVEDEHRRLLAARAAAAQQTAPRRSTCRCPAAPTISVLVPRSSPPPEQRVELGNARLPACSLWPIAAVLGRDQAREDLQPAACDHVVVKAAAEVAAAELDDAQPPPLGAVLRVQLLAAG